MRLRELGDPEGAVLAQGFHESITVVSATRAARAALLAALPSETALVVRASDLDAELERAAEAAEARYQGQIEETRGLVAAASAALDEARRSLEEAVHEAKVASVELEGFEQLAERLASAEENYEAAVRAEAETARSLATALSELDRVLAQRQSASASVDEARKSRDNQGVPEAVLTQALNVQAALGEAFASRQEAVKQADATYQDARSAARHALGTLESAHHALRQGIAPAYGPNRANGRYDLTGDDDNRSELADLRDMSNTADLGGLADVGPFGFPDSPAAFPERNAAQSGPLAGPLGPGVPLRGVVGNYRDGLAARARSAQAAERRARDVEAAALSHLAALERDLEALLSAGGPEPPGLEVALEWARTTDLAPESALVADDAFARFGAQGVAALLEAIAGRGCQVVYLTEDPAVLSWAIGLPREVGAATAATTPRPRRLALVGG